MNHKYKFSELRKLGRGKLPADVNDSVKEMLKPLEKKIGSIDHVFSMIDKAREKAWFSDKPGAVVIDPVKGRAIVMLEFHSGIIKKFSMLHWFSDHCYFPVNIKNDMVDFSKERKKPENKTISNGVK